ncbi:MAG: hypothetical protein GTN62_15410 [Gemmatimonadales bacterium]|nr:hypothetical protein [Gemmatimonadales bacterium]NIN13199.1 hypothetical protein [Gemmatimonadales bacterium]NIN51477.1 hypothetical protein [Gemmatimonadales bacterium]NIP08941.1 hypothetical protein [Gemmatimonadales bacterium]NIR03729.1 hypothetical protein [Gemmatimonadales bacterium]
MKPHCRLTVGMVALASTVLTGAGALDAQEAPVKAELPVLLTSCGQSPGPQRVRFFLKRLELEHEFFEQATAQNLRDRSEAGNPFRAIIIVTGASLKGMGAAGVSIKDELTRTEALIAEAKRQGITIIGAHVEGMARRAQGAAPGDNSDELSIDAVIPKSDLIVVRQDGNADRRFSIISENLDIPLILFDKNMELGSVLRSVFDK